MSAAWSAEEYASEQKKRLEELRKATERERNLLSQSRVEAAQRPTASPPRNSRITDVASQEQTTMREVSEGIPRPDDRLKDLYSQHELELNKLRQQFTRARELENLLLQDERSCDEAERTVQHRLRTCDTRKGELLAQLQSLQYREKELDEAEEQLKIREENERRKSEEMRERQRSLTHQESTVQAEYNERVALLQAAERKEMAHREENQRESGRLALQVTELEDRCRGIEGQIAVKARLIEDLERETTRLESRQRNMELRAIDNLRRTIEARSAASRSSVSVS